MASSPSSGPSSGGYLVEFLQIGNAVKVSAIDPKSGVEVSIVGSPRTSRDILTKTAIQKLEFRLAQLKK